MILDLLYNYQSFESFKIEGAGNGYGITITADGEVYHGGALRIDEALFAGLIYLKARILAKQMVKDAKVTID